MRKNGRSAVYFILLGIAIVVIPFLLRMRREQDTQMYVKEFEEEEHEEKADKKKDSKEKFSKEKVSLLSKEGVIGIIEIPDLNIKYPIFEGTGNTQLNEGIGHMTETAGLCGKGNCVLAGHNGSRRGVYFTYLSNIEAGTRVKLTNKKRETHEYMAQEMRVVSPICTNLLVKNRELCHNKIQGVIYYGHKYRRINKTFTRRIPAGML